MIMNKKRTKKGLLMLICGLLFATNSFASNVTSTYSPEEINTFYDKIKNDSEFQEKLRNFQEQELVTLASQTSLTESNIQQSQQEIGGIYDELQKVQKQFDTINSQKKFLDAKINETKQSIQIVLDQAKKTQSETDAILKQVMEYTNKIKLTKEAIAQTNSDKEKARDMASKFLDILYKLTNELYTANSDIDDIKLFLKSENISTDLSNTDLLQMISMRYEQLVSVIEEKQSNFKTLLNTLEESQLQYKSKLSEYRKKLDILNQQNQYLTEYVQAYSTSKDGLTSKEADLQKSKQQLLQDLQKQIAESNTFIQANSYLKNKLSSSETYGDNEQFLSRPLYPIEKIEWKYNSIDYVKRYGDNNIGIDILTPQWTEVYAPADWYIYDIKSPEGMSLSYLIIIHNYGYTSLITTLNDTVVAKWQYVSRGQLLGISGWEPGTKWAGFGSNGAKIHRELFKDAAPVSIFEHTDLSSVKNINALPTQFEIKVLRDKLARKIDLSSVSYIQWASLEERIKNYINKYGNAPFDSYTLWQQAAAGHKVSLELPVCIAVAETSFGIHFASAWNIGNVGNNDRWDRIDFSWPVEGASVIYYALENQYLWGYHTLDKLSGYGNKAWPVYASSPINRQTNIVKCLTEIRGYRVPDDAPVRTY
jgi:murein DD-endopeptidase MepM/ murein hydrolase activator NlpD